ncbi:MAG: hypothetical protein BWY79_00060 [Actinobacteria bacterium ADurb.Bin444]|nr:MAG: hypothetical protein BWY79_00060 [Actinobacteria bacterium ADurb.Bin444]
MGDRAHAIAAQPYTSELLPHPARVEVKVQVDKLHRLRVERGPWLAPEQITGDRFEVALAGEFEDERPRGSQNVRHPAQDCRCIGRMVQCADHRDRIESPGDKRQMVEVGLHIDKTRIAVRAAFSEPCHGLRELRMGKVEQHDRVVPGIEFGQPPEAGADLQERSSAGRQHSLERHALHGVLIAARLGPELGAIAGALIAADGRRCRVFFRSFSHSFPVLIAVSSTDTS